MRLARADLSSRLNGDLLLSGEGWMITHRPGLSINWWQLREVCRYLLLTKYHHETSLHLKGTPKHLLVYTGAFPSRQSLSTARRALRKQQQASLESWGLTPHHRAHRAIPLHLCFVAGRRALHRSVLPRTFPRRTSSQRRPSCRKIR